MFVLHNYCTVAIQFDYWDLEAKRFTSIFKSYHWKHFRCNIPQTKGPRPSEKKNKKKKSKGSATSCSLLGKQNRWWQRRHCNWSTFIWVHDLSCEKKKREWRLSPMDKNFMWVTLKKNTTTQTLTQTRSLDVLWTDFCCVLFANVFYGLFQDTWG